MGKGNITIDKSMIKTVFDGKIITPLPKVLVENRYYPMFSICSPTHCNDCGNKLHVNSHYTRFILSSYGTIACDVTYWFCPVCKKHFHDQIIGVPGSANYSSEYYDKQIPCPTSLWLYEQKQAELSKQELLDQKFDFDGTLYVDGDWTKAGWKKRLEELIGKQLTKKEWKKLRYKSVCVVATKEKVILDFEITDSLPDSRALIPLMERIKNRFPEGKIKRIVSDEDNAIIEAVKTVFPEVSHSFCVYHQLKNVGKKYSEEFKAGDEIPIEDEIVYNEIYQLITSDTVVEATVRYQNMLNSESYLELSKASLKAISYAKEIFKRNVDHMMKGFTPVTNNTMEQTFSLIRDIIENVRSFKTESGLANFCYNLFTYFNNRYFATGKWRGFSPLMRAKLLYCSG